MNQPNALNQSSHHASSTPILQLYTCRVKIYIYKISILSIKRNSLSLLNISFTGNSGRWRCFRACWRWWFWIRRRFRARIKLEILL